jgi:hypothetical protein
MTFFHKRIKNMTNEELNLMAIRRSNQLIMTELRLKIDRDNLEEVIDEMKKRGITYARK